VKILKLVKNDLTFCFKLHIKSEVKRDRFERMDVGVKWMPDY